MALLTFSLVVSLDQKLSDQLDAVISALGGGGGLEPGEYQALDDILSKMDWRIQNIKALAALTPPKTI